MKVGLTPYMHGLAKCQTNDFSYMKDPNNANLARYRHGSSFLRRHLVDRNLECIKGVGPAINGSLVILASHR